MKSIISQDNPKRTVSNASMRMKAWITSPIVLFIVFFVPGKAIAQYNTNRLMLSGEIALHYEDYVLSIQYFNQVIVLKPYLYRPWQYRGIAKFYLEDYSGAEYDVTQALKLNPYIDGLYDLRAIAYVRQDKYKEAIDDYTHAIRLNPDQRNYWFNRALCQMNQ